MALAWGCEETDIIFGSNRCNLLPNRKKAFGTDNNECGTSIKFNKKII